MSEKTISIQFPMSFVRKLKAYRDITGKPSEIDTAYLIESIVNDELAELLGLNGPLAPGVVEKGFNRPHIVPTDASEVAEGLGEEISEEDVLSEEQEKAAIRKSLESMRAKATFSDKDLEDDLRVDDPSKEAKAEAIRLEPDQDPEEAFDELIPPPKKRRRGAKVSLMTEMPGDVS